jgi:hypothetical protein
MINRVPASARVSGCALSAAFLVLGCVACAATMKPTAGPSAAVSLPGATTTATASAAPVPSATPANLVADATVRRELHAAFIAFRGNAANTPGFAAIPPSAVAGITPGTLYYALDPATGIYWAVATFSATAAARQTVAFVGFQDGGSQAVFTRPSGGSWRVESAGPCMTRLPVDVAAAWGLTATPSPMCPSGVPAG